jgi:hypothetical protein
MARIALPLTVLAVATLGACATYDEYPTTPTVVTAPNATSSVPATTVYAAPVTTVTAVAPRAFRPGWGIVESVSVVRGAPVASASAGASMGIYRVAVRMDDGTVQAFDVDRALNVHERVELTADGRVVRS